MSSKISVPSQSPATPGRIDAACHNLSNRFDRLRNDRGHWVGELSPSALSTATAISALSFFLESDSELTPVRREQIEVQVAAGLNWLVKQQNEDGGFGDTALSYSNISTSMLVIAAIHAAGRADQFESLIQRTQRYVDQQGGIPGLRKRYGKDKTFAVPILANCAMAGIVPWKEVSALPFEAACVPQRFYHLMQLPVVSYAIPALVAIGQAKFHFDPPWDPLRRTIRGLAVKRSLDVLSRMQPASGGYLEAVPLTSFVVMALVKSGKSNHSVVANGVRFLIDSFLPLSESSGGQANGNWPIDTNLATWSTTLTINAMASDPASFGKQVAENREHWQRCLDWVLSCQYQEVHPFTGSPPGGWGWTDLTGSVPDADDTPGALLALKHLWQTGKFEDSQDKIFLAVQKGFSWLLKLQNRDRGWPTFCRGWGKYPFDRSGSDITAHVIRGLLAWQGELANTGLAATNAGVEQINPLRVESAIERGFEYLRKTQRSDGSWLPLWFGNQDQPDDINPFYGTAKVLCAYRDAKRIDTQWAQFGLNWLLENQNPDGGFGGGASITWKDPSLGHSSVEETALCTDILLAGGEPCRQAAEAGLDWLLRAIELDCIDQYSPIGFYFAKLWYYEKSYPLIFATSALAQAKSIGLSTTGDMKIQSADNI